jgi:integrase
VRVGEALALIWDDLDTEHGTLAVMHTLSRGWDETYERASGKTNKSRRTIPMSATPMAALRRQRTLQKRQRLSAGSAWQDEGFIFTNGVGQSLRQEAVYKALHRALTSLGLPQVRVHDLRHTCARLMRENGASIEAISTSFGHSTIAITADLYAHLGDPQRREAADAMERAIGGG